VGCHCDTDQFVAGALRNGAFQLCPGRRLSKSCDTSNSALTRSSSGLPAAFRSAALQSEKLISQIMRHEQTLFAHQSTACMADHDVEARLCRWLLRARDLLRDQLKKLAALLRSTAIKRPPFDSDEDVPFDARPRPTG
jgi:hypothetical protein